jgi:hypothetical protein
MTLKVNYGYFSGVGSGIAGNVLRLGEGYEALALCGWSSLRQTAVIRCIIFFVRGQLTNL